MIQCNFKVLKILGGYILPREKHSRQEEKYTTVKKFNSVFANRLSELISVHKKKVNTDQLAKELGVTVRAIQLWENRQSRPDIDRLISIADYFGVTVDYLVGRSHILVSTLEEAAICEYTGLDENAIKRLLKLNKDNYATWYIDIINDFITSENFEDFIALLTVYITETEDEKIYFHDNMSFFTKQSVNKSDVNLFSLQEYMKEIAVSLRNDMKKKFINGKLDYRFLLLILKFCLKNSYISEVEYGHCLYAIYTNNYEYFKDKSNFSDQKVAIEIQKNVDNIIKNQKEIQDNTNNS